MLKSYPFSFKRPAIEELPGPPLSHITRVFGSEFAVSTVLLLLPKLRPFDFDKILFVISVASAVSPAIK